MDTQNLRALALEKAVEFCDGALGAPIVVDTAEKFLAFLEGKGETPAGEETSKQPRQWHRTEDIPADVQKVRTADDYTAQRTNDGGGWQYTEIHGAPFGHNLDGAGWKYFDDEDFPVTEITGEPATTEAYKPKPGDRVHAVGAYDKTRAYFGTLKGERVYKQDGVSVIIDEEDGIDTYVLTDSIRPA